MLGPTWTVRDEVLCCGIIAKKTAVYVELSSATNFKRHTLLKPLLCEIVREDDCLRIIHIKGISTDFVQLWDDTTILDELDLIDDLESFLDWICVLPDDKLMMRARIIKHELLNLFKPK